ncbi:hypothetical protein OGAPHI_007423 [Ogataea philodendri]|uniref:Secreted protein n=1 Tax=Ogataea philodendri TaxID=1378263 RepID=A0A9P8NTS2_9ASCO|nr:uncharacterized protein OGAPHI_007423 [Ogataea philodendri]KAH3660218.1 hypothetical protein OGAPHI_007423 [Ogataea philodendri]
MLVFVSTLFGLVTHSSRATSADEGVAVVLRTYHKSLALDGTAVDGFYDIDKLLFVANREVELVVVACAKVAHHVLVAVEEHHRHRVVQLVHLVEVGNLVDVAQIDNGKLADLGRNPVQQLVHQHAVAVGVAAKPDHHQTVVLGQNGLVNVPARSKVRQKYASHVFTD